MERRSKRVALVVLALAAAAAAWWVTRADQGTTRAGPALEGGRNEEGELLPARELLAGSARVESSDQDPERADASTDVADTSAVERKPGGLDESFTQPNAQFPLTPALDVPNYEVEGRLLRESGAWSREELPGRDELVIELVSAADPTDQRRARLVIEGQDDGSVSFGYLFKSVPEGEYELSIFSLGTLRWSPRSVRVVPPAYGMDFLCHDLDDQSELRFEVFDARSGDALESFSAAHLEQTVSAESGVFMHAGPIEAGSFPGAERFRWSVWAEGYRAVFGDERAFQLVEGVRVARVELSPGWSARIVVLGRDPAMRPLMNAEIVIDEHSVGRTDEEGALVVEFDERPKSIDVRYRDWRLENDPFDSRPGTTADLRGHVLPLIVAAPE